MASDRERYGKKNKTKNNNFKSIQILITSKDNGLKINSTSFSWYVAPRINFSKDHRSTSAMADFQIDYFS